MSQKSSFRQIKKQGRRLLRQVGGRRLARMSTLKWVAFGVGAYGLLHLMKNRGILARQAGQAIDLVDRGAQSLVAGLAGGPADRTRVDVMAHH